MMPSTAKAHSLGQQDKPTVELGRAGSNMASVTTQIRPVSRDREDGKKENELNGSAMILRKQRRQMNNMLIRRNHRDDYT